jgi:hypothetical protein
MTRLEDALIKLSAMTERLATAEAARDAAVARAEALSFPYEETAKGLAAWKAGSEAGERRATAAIAADLREQAARDIEGAAYCRSGNAGNHLRAYAQRRRDDADRYEAGHHLPGDAGGSEG